jgi:tripartite-type tricarboxylate transporter receptor subunit TctC
MWVRFLPGRPKNNYETIMKLLLTTLLLLFFSTPNWAWQPTRPINVLIGFAPGSSNELSFRAVAQQVEQATGAKFVVINQPGADGLLSLNNLNESAPDGHTINIASEQNTWVMSDVLYPREMKFNPEGFTHTLGLSRSPLVIIAPADSLINTPRELVRLLETTTQPVNFAVGSSSHRLAYQYLLDNIKSRKDLIAAASYRSPGQAATDVAAKVVDFGIVSASLAQSLVATGKVKIISICGDRELSRLPGVPTMQAAVPGLEVYVGVSILLPPNTSQEIQKWYATHFASALRSDQSRRFREENLMFVDEQDLTPGGHRRTMMALRQKWLPIAQKMDFKR